MHVGPGRGREGQRHPDGLLLPGHDGHHGQHRQPGRQHHGRHRHRRLLGSGYTDLDPQSKINEQVGVDEYPGHGAHAAVHAPRRGARRIWRRKTRCSIMGFFTSANAIANPCNLPKRWEEALQQAGVQRGHGHRRSTPTAEAVCDLFLPVNTYAERDMYVATHYGALRHVDRRHQEGRHGGRGEVRHHHHARTGNPPAPGAVGSGTRPTSSTSTTRSSAP